MLVGVVAVALAAGATASSSPGVALLGVLLIAGLVIGGIGLSGRRSPVRVANQKRFRRALWLWNRCWYCRRCGAVSLFTRNGSRRLDPGNLAGTLTELAESLRWPENERA